MKLFVSIAALATIALARVQVMLPLYAYPVAGTDISPSWKATIDAIKAHPNVHFYLVINPSNGPTDGSSFSPGYNNDFTTYVSQLNGFSNAQTVGYVSTDYGKQGTNPSRNRTVANIHADIDEWAKWQNASTWTDPSPTANISIHGIWFDETSSDPKDLAFYQELTSYAKNAFNTPGRFQYSAVLNVGVNMTLEQERNLYALGDAVVSRETCWQLSSDANKGECPTPYTHYDASTLKGSFGLPNNVDLYPKAVVIVHYVQSDPPVNSSILADQIKQTVAFGIHSTYFTSAKLWETTVAEPATIGAVAQAVDAAQP